MKNIDLVLAKHPFFYGISEEFIPDLAILADVVTFEPGDVLFKEGDAADKFYLIIKGKIAIQTAVSYNDAITIQTVEDGEIVGWSWIVKPYKYKFGARVVEKTEMIVFNAEKLRTECEMDAELGFEIMKLLVQAVSTRLEQTRLLVLDVYGKNKK